MVTQCWVQCRERFYQCFIPSFSRHVVFMVSRWPVVKSSLGGTPGQTAQISPSHWGWHWDISHSSRMSLQPLPYSEHVTCWNCDWLNTKSSFILRVWFDITVFNYKLYSKFYINSAGWDSILLKGTILTWLPIIPMHSPSLPNFIGPEEFCMFCHTIWALCFQTVVIQSHILEILL